MNAERSLFPPAITIARACSKASDTRSSSLMDSFRTESKYASILGSRRALNFFNSSSICIEKGEWDTPQSISYNVPLEKRKMNEIKMKDMPSNGHTALPWLEDLAHYNGRYRHSYSNRTVPSHRPHRLPEPWDFQSRMPDTKDEDSPFF